MKALSHLFHAVLIGAITILALSCTKTPVIEYNLDGIEGKWLVTSTTGKIVIGYDTVFAVNDTVRYYKLWNNPDLPYFYVSRPGENRYYEERYGFHFFLKHGYGIKDNRQSFEIIGDSIYTFELIESTKEQIVFRFANNGSKVTMKKEE